LGGIAVKPKTPHIAKQKAKLHALAALGVAGFFVGAAVLAILFCLRLPSVDTGGMTVGILLAMWVAFCSLVTLMALVIAMHFRSRAR
jgi:hypothetical protein